MNRQRIENIVVIVLFLGSVALLTLLCSRTGFYALP